MEPEDDKSLKDTECLDIERDERQCKVYSTDEKPGGSLGAPIGGIPPEDGGIWDIDKFRCDD